MIGGFAARERSVGCFAGLLCGLALGSGCALNNGLR
jgi:hypothetical protein